MNARPEQGLEQPARQGSGVQSAASRGGSSTGEAPDRQGTGEGVLEANLFETVGPATDDHRAPRQRAESAGSSASEAVRLSTH